MPTVRATHHHTENSDVTAMEVDDGNADLNIHDPDAVSDGVPIAGDNTRSPPRKKTRPVLSDSDDESNAQDSQQCIKERSTGHRWSAH
eukprot:COSAG02_NODE_12304_length_1565_cov_1.899045_2_plen_88_part_00